MTAQDKKNKIEEMQSKAAEYNRRGDAVLRDQMLRSIKEAKATWSAAKRR